MTVGALIPVSWIQREPAEPPSAKVDRSNDPATPPPDPSQYKKIVGSDTLIATGLVFLGALASMIGPLRFANLLRGGPRQWPAQVPVGRFRLPEILSVMAGNQLVLGSQHEAAIERLLRHILQRPKMGIRTAWKQHHRKAGEWIRYQFDTLVLGDAELRPNAFARFGKGPETAQRLSEFIRSRIFVLPERTRGMSQGEYQSRLDIWLRDLLKRFPGEFEVVARPLGPRGVHEANVDYIEALLKSPRSS